MLSFVGYSIVGALTVMNIFFNNNELRNNKCYVLLYQILVPDYKTVMLETSNSHRSRRDLRPVEFDIDGNKVQLHLNPIKDNVMNYVPVWTVETDRQSSTGHRYQKLTRVRER